MSPCCQLEWPKNYYQPLFDHMLDEHGLTLLDSEMDEICRTVDKMKGGDRMAVTKKVAPKLPKGRIGKAVAKKK